MRSIFAVLGVNGTPAEQGRRHGVALKGEIAENVALYFRRFEEDVGLARDEVIDRARSQVPVITERNPGYIEGMMGIAEGSGRTFDEILALNARYELLYYEWANEAKTDGCTAFAVSPSRSSNGHLLMGQNWDWIPGVRGAVVLTTHPDGLKTLAFTEAGIFGGKIGLNSSGLGLSINGMTTATDEWSRAVEPFHSRCHRLLSSTRFEDAVEVIRGEERACSTNFLIAQAPDRIVDVEAAPFSVNEIVPHDGLLAHANHFVAPGEIGVIEPRTERRPQSCAREGRMRSLLNGGTPITTESIREMLKDHQGAPYGLCRHPDLTIPEAERTVTIASFVMDLTARELTVVTGNPCTGPTQKLTL